MVDKRWLVWLLALALPVLAACGTTEPTPAVMPATPTPLPTSLPGELDYEPVAIAEAGLALQVPAGWRRLEPEWAWTPGEDGLPRLGLAWADLQPPMEADAALLPHNAQVLSSDPISLDWADGRRIVLETYGLAPAGGGRAPVQSVEMHVLVVTQQASGRRAFDFFLAARDSDELASFRPVFDTLLASVSYSQEPVGGDRAPIEPALAAQLLGDFTALCEWEVWAEAERTLYVWAVCQSATGSAASAPAVVHLDAAGVAEAVAVPRDGSLLAPDVRRLFPPDIQPRILAGDFDASAALERIAVRARSRTGRPHPEWQPYIDLQLLISLRFPGEWQRQAGYDHRYGGPDGFFQVAALEGGGRTLDQLCDAEAHHELLPYGSQPVIEMGTVAGQRACWILPSADQPRGMSRQAALIASYPRPVPAGAGVYEFAILWTDLANLKEIGATLEFLPADG